MKITLTFDSNDKDELDTVLAILGASPVGKDVAPNISAQPEDRQDPAAEEEAPAEEETPTEEEAPAEEETTAEGDGDGEGDDFLDGDEDEVTHTIEDVRKALKAYATKTSKAKAVKILKDHGAAAISELDPSKYGDVVRATEADD